MEKHWFLRGFPPQNAKQTSSPRIYLTPPGFYWIAGSPSCHKGHKMAVLFILVSPQLLWNDVSEVFELRHYAAVMRDSHRAPATLSPTNPPFATALTIYTYIYVYGGGVCCFYFRTKIIRITFYMYAFVFSLLLMFRGYRYLTENATHCILYIYHSVLLLFVTRSTL